MNSIVAWEEMGIVKFCLFSCCTGLANKHLAKRSITAKRRTMSLGTLVAMGLIRVERFMGSLWLAGGKLQVPV